MPIASRFFIEQLKNFALEISIASKTVRLQQMEAAELLLQEIDENSLYPFDYLVYRITGYRGDVANQPTLLGSAVLADLVSLVALVSRTMVLPAHGMMDVGQTAKKLNISTRTISRLRREGLIFHWVVEADGRRRLGCSPSMLAQFVAQNERRIQKASNFSRLTEDEKKELIASAIKLKGEKQYMSEVAVEVAKHSHRDHETIRLLLERDSLMVQMFKQATPLTKMDVREIEQELRSGTPWLELENRYERSTGAIRKTVARLRLSRLKKLDITHVELDVFSRVDAEEVILGAPSAQHVDPVVLSLDSHEVQTKSFVLDNETAVVSAMHLLRRRASMRLSTIGYSPTEIELDRIETDLRWSFLLQQMLVVVAMRSSLAVAVQHVGRPLQELPANRFVSLLKHIVQILGETCGTLDPSKGQTAKKTPASVLDRNLHLFDIYSKPLRAAAKYKTIEILCPYHQIVPWSFLLPTEDFSALAKKESSEFGKIVSLRFGWDGCPKTVDEIASILERTSISVARKLRGWI